MTEPPTTLPPDELIVTLRKPIEFAGEFISQIPLREPTIGEIAALKGLTGADETIRLAFLVSGVSEPALRKIPISDFRRIGEYLMGFL